MTSPQPMSSSGEHLSRRAWGALLVLCGAFVSSKRLDAYYHPYDLWQQVLAIQPNNHIAHENMGDLFEKQGDLPAAMQHYREAIRIKPEHAVPHNSLGLLLLQSNDLPAALAELKEVVRLDDIGVGLC